MSPVQHKPILHGRDHGCGGADPIPGICDVLRAPAGSYQEIVLAEPSLVGYWPLDEASGDALDASGNGYTLDERGTPVHGEDGPFSDPADPTSTRFNYAGTETGVTTPAEDAFYLATDFGSSIVDDLSFEAWLYPTVLPAINAGIVTYVDGTYNTIGFQLRHESDGKILWQGDTVSVTSSAALPLATWAHVVGTMSGSSGMKLYFDGGLVVSGANQTPNPAAVHFMLAAYITAALNARHFQGRMAQVALYSEALDAGTVNTHYEAGAGAGIAGSEGMVPTSDGAGGVAWALPTVEVEF